MTTSFKCVTDYDAVISAVEIYAQTAKTGDGAKMKTAFYDDAIIQGYIGPDYVGGPIQILCDWANDNAGGDNIKARIAAVDIVGTAATVRVEVENWVGLNFTDFLSLLKTEGEWKISSKVYHTHA